MFCCGWIVLITLTWQGAFGAVARAEEMPAVSSTATEKPVEKTAPKEEAVTTQAAEPQTEKKKIYSKDTNLLVYFTHKDQDEIEELRAMLRPLSGGCSKCEVVVTSIGYKDSAIDLKDLQKKMTEVPENTKVMVFDFNLRDTPETKFWSEQVRQLQAKNILVVSSTGRALESEIPMLLKKTVLGQNSKVIIIGELYAKERMWPLSHFGPEILTALKLPDDLSGQDLAGFYVAVHLLPRIQQKTTDAWVDQLSEKKFKTKKIWLDVDEL